MHTKYNLSCTLAYHSNVQIFTVHLCFFRVAFGVIEMVGNLAQLGTTTFAMFLYFMNISIIKHN